ncbi:hypothetical protein BZA05DRAFT_457606 [Tricharina praecox]|uniref:uncharacterized protein n=1 Tax=Tricharina praecox TaxID=43433 RepID=UPI00221E3F3A|nr:uncharacterized protein BZA05DRAFT_457606 [Tricharina praecox]KAI5847518.1 hypothetical protein BZA05DRAFT_457606 [Tricharina praecox]
MDPTAFQVVYVDRRASCDRVVFRDATGQNGIGQEHGTVEENAQSLLLAFSSVSICNSAQSCLTTLSDNDGNNPILLLVEVPIEPQPDEDNNIHDGRHDSGIASGPADMMLGLPLLKYVCSEIESMRMPNSIIPVALLTHDDDGLVAPRAELEDDSRTARELKCIDNGAWDAFENPLSKDSVRTMHMHCYRARKTIQKTRKRSWVGIDEPKADNYSYLREKIRVRIPITRANDVEKAVGRWDFSAHDFSDEELVHCAQTMFQHAFTMPEVSEFVIPPDRMVDFLLACRGTYNDQVPYHNFRHVVDVLQAVFFFMLQLGALPHYKHHKMGELDEESTAKSLAHLITPLDALTLLVVAIGHDVGHPGVNNAFLVTLKAPLAQLYNDRSVLESFHCAAFSQVLRKHWPKALDQRKMIIDMILATDMGLHFDFMGKLDKLRKKYEKEGGSGVWEEKSVNDHRILLCALIIKCADISNVARKHECSAQWATILIEEFSRQANMEVDLGIPSSLVAPPITGSVVALAKSQVGFMNLFAIPLFQNLSTVLPEMQFSVSELVSNKDAWSRKSEVHTYQRPEDNKTSGSAQQQQKLASSSLSVPSSRPQSTHEHEQHHAPNRHHLPPVLGTALMEADIPNSDNEPSISGSEIRSGVASPRLNDTTVQRHPGNGNAAAVTVVVTHPKIQTNGYGPVSEKRPTYQHSTEHLRAVSPNDASSSPDRPRSSPPDLGDCSDQSCSKGCCNTAIIPSGTMERRSSRFFKKVKLWKTWRKEPSDG